MSVHSVIIEQKVDNFVLEQPKLLEAKIRELLYGSGSELSKKGVFFLVALAEKLDSNQDEVNFIGSDLSESLSTLAEEIVSGKVLKQKI